VQYRTLGRTGIKVSPYALGALMFATQVGNPDPADSIRVIHKALDAGINFIDTSDAYGDSEEIVGQALEGRRDNVVLATKFSRPTGTDPNQQGTSRRWIMTAVENSLRRLRTDHIDLYQVHRLDPDTDVEETLAALTDLIRAGKVRPSGRPTRRPATSSRRSGSPSGVAWNASGPSNRRTRSSTAASRPRCCRPRSATGWGRWSGARSGRACSPAGSAGASRTT
jgi:predicted oxidoreductase